VIKLTGKIAISSSECALDSNVDPRFGRCTCFVLVEEGSEEGRSIPNAAQSAGNGAGIQAAQTLLDNGVSIVLTGDIGPNAFRVLAAAGVKVFCGCSGTGRAALQDYRKGALKETVGPSRPGHHQHR
jgi:predicted Fe-Mo cluster-binding NifX family protein